MSNDVRDDAAIAAAEERVEARSADFRKELGLRDLVLTQILYVVGVSWVGTAAKLGSQQLAFWVLAILTFYIPQAASVIWLSRRFPLEGGIYQWAKLGFSPRAAFMVAWNLWVYAIVLLAAFGVTVSRNLSYALGADAARITDSRWFILAVSVALLAGLVVVAVRGLGVAKWVHNAGGLLLLGAFAVLIALPIVRAARGVAPVYRPLDVAMPAMSLMSINIFSKMALGALSGFEYVAIVAGETRAPERAIAKSVVIAAPVIALMFTLGTAAMLALVGPEQVDLISPIPQAFSVGFGGALAWIVPVTILMITARTIASSSMLFTGTTRLPMVAGWDALLPAWFARLHPRFRTPVNSILFIGVMALVFAIWGTAGVGAQEAFQLLDHAAGVFYAATYVVLFLLPITGFRNARGADRPPLWLVLSSLLGLSVTILYAVFSIFPIVTVKSELAFSLRMSGMIVGGNLLGLALYILLSRRHRASGADHRDSAITAEIAALPEARPDARPSAESR